MVGLRSVLLPLAVVLAVVVAASPALAATQTSGSSPLRAIGSILQSAADPIPLPQADQACALCQFWVQHMKGTMLNGVSAASSSSSSFSSESTPSPTDVDNIPGLLLETGGLFDSLKGAAKAGAQGVTTAAKMENLPWRRDMAQSVLQGRPLQARYSGLGVPSVRNKQFNELYTSVYADFENECATRSPPKFMPVCLNMLSRFHTIAEGLLYDERPDLICIKTEFCSSTSYVMQSVHTLGSD